MTDDNTQRDRDIADLAFFLACQNEDLRGSALKIRDRAAARILATESVVQVGEGTVLTTLMTDELNILKLRGLLEIGTTTPWPLDYVSGAVRHIARNVDPEAFLDADSATDKDFCWNRYSDASLIVGAVNALPALLDAAEERNNLRAESNDVANAFERYKPLTDSLETTAHSLVNAAHERDALKDNLNTLIAEAEEIFGSGGFHAARMERFRQAIAAAKEGL